MSTLGVSLSLLVESRSLTYSADMGLYLEELDPDLAVTYEKSIHSSPQGSDDGAFGGLGKAEAASDKYEQAPATQRDRTVTPRQFLLWLIALAFAAGLLLFTKTLRMDLMDIFMPGLYIFIFVVVVACICL